MPEFSTPELSSLFDSSSQRREFIALRSFPAVISGAHIRELRENLETQPQIARDFVGGYLGFDPRAHDALSQTVQSLAAREKGGAFWLNGVYGSGKSHLLGALALLCDEARLKAPKRLASAAFCENFPHFRAAISAFAPRLVVTISLDEYNAASHDLEAIFWRELRAQAARFSLEIPEFRPENSRAESFAALHETLERQSDFRGVALFFDELSLFLAGRDATKIQHDAAFLQFLGQHARRAPFWIFAALQKTIDDIGGLEPYSLGQIRDRFTLLPLSLAHLPTLIEKRLVQPHDEAALDAWCARTFSQSQTALSRLDFGPHEWRALFPFHPASVQLLEAVTGRFFSRTRSAALFCSALNLEESAQKRVGADEIWDYFAPEIATHPDLRPLREVFDTWNDLAPTIAPAHENTLRRVIKFLLVCKVAGHLPTPIHVANALELHREMPGELDGEAPYEWARQLLEKLRRGAPFLAVERDSSREGRDFSDRYTLDFGKRIADGARRHLQNALENIEPFDARLGALAVQKSREWPLESLENGRAVSVFWANTPRQIEVKLWRGETAETLSNRLWSLRENPQSSGALALILPPFSRDEFDFSALRSALGELQNALWVWKPRTPSRDEWELARENLAAHLCAHDPALLDNRRGRAILEHLQKEAPAREAALDRVVSRLFSEGEIAGGSGAALEAAELVRGADFAAKVEALADFALPQLFPKFALHAPRARVLTPSNADALCLEILRRPLDEPFFAPSLERLCRHIAQPLGLAQSSAGRWKIGAPHEKIGAQIGEILGEAGATLGALETHLARGAWGFSPEMTALCVCGALRSGEIAAFDSRGAALEPAKIGLPLRRSVYFLRNASLPDAPTWTKIAVWCREIWGQKLGAPSFEAFGQLGAQLESWRAELRRELEIARARSAQIRRLLRHDNALWSEFDACCTALGDLVERLEKGADAREKWAIIAATDAPKWNASRRQFERFAQALEARLGEICALGALLLADDLALPESLARARIELQARLQSGERLLFDDEFFAAARAWREEYGALYREWHGAQHNPARGASLRRILGGDALRALERLGTLQTRNFGEGASIRAQIEDELQKLCTRDGGLDAGRATCSSCALRLGERLIFADARALETQIETQIAQFSAQIQSGAPRQILGRAQSPILDWNGESQTLLPFLGAQTLADLERAFAPRQKFTRDLRELESRLRGCLTKSECETAFAQWLCGEDAPASDDEIEFLTE